MAGNERDELRSSEDDHLMDFIPERLTDEADPVSNGGGKGKSLLVAGALIGVAVAGAAGFYALSGSGGSDGKVTAPVIPADTTAYKVRPADPGGMQVPNQDKLVYDRLEPTGEARPEVETLLPEPRMPAAPPPPASLPMEQTAAAPAPEEAVERLSQATTDGPMVPPPPALEGEVTPPQGIQVPGAAAQDAPAEAVTSASKAAPAPAPEPVSAPKTETVPTPAPEKAAAPEAAPVVKDTPPEPAKPAPVAAPGAKSQGEYMIQLAALRSEDAARKHFQALQGKYPTLIGPLSLVVEKADLGDKGVFYRVRAVGLASEQAAKNACAQLSKDKVGCLFVGKK